MKIRGVISHKSIRTIIILGLIMVFTSCSGVREKKQKPSATEGRLDLSGWDFSTDGIYPLDGEWEFYWNQFIKPGEFEQVENTGTREYFYLPDFWNNKTIGKEKIKGSGFATLRLNVKISKDEDILEMRIIRLYTAYNIWLNGKLAESEGEVGISIDTESPSFGLKEILITDQAEDLEIVIHISNFHHNKGGARTSIYLGKPDQIIRYGKTQMSYDLFLVTIILIMNLYIFWLYSCHPDDKSLLYFALVCFFTITHLLVGGEMLIDFFLNDIRWETLMKFDYVSNYLRAAFVALFLSHTFPREISKYFSMGMLAWASVFSILILFTRSAFYTRTMLLFEIVIAIAIVYVIFGLVKAILRSKTGAVYIAIGTVALIATAVNDILFSEMIINSVLLFPGGLFICIFSYSFLLFARYTKLNRSFSRLSRRLLTLDKIKNAFIANTSKYNLEIPFKAILENTNATKGFIYFREEEKWVLKVYMSLDDMDGLENLPSITDFSDTAEEKPFVPFNLINMVIAEERNILLENVIGEDSIKHDPYFRKHQVISALCVRIESHEHLIGLLYLENQKVVGAFNREILATLDLLSPQLTTMLDNIEIFRQLELLNKSLEQKVKERTAELTRQKHDIEIALENLKKTQHQLVLSGRMASLGLLTAGIAHELNNPINFISGNIKPLKRDIEDILALLEKYETEIQHRELANQFGEVDKLREEMDLEYLVAEINKLLEGIGEGAFRSGEIVRGLRSFSKLDEDKCTIVNVHEGIDTTLVLLRNRIKDRIHVHLQYGEIPKIECRPAKLNQVFMNILVNAIESIVETGDIFITTSNNKSTIKIKIKDSGRGMSDKIKDHIFEPFFTTKDVGDGTGLGLSISYGIIEQHKGRIHVLSEPGKGSEFIILLPIKQGE